MVHTRVNFEDILKELIHNRVARELLTMLRREDIGGFRFYSNDITLELLDREGELVDITTGLNNKFNQVQLSIFVFELYHKVSGQVLQSSKSMLFLDSIVTLSPSTKDKEPSLHYRRLEYKIPMRMVL